MLPRIGDPYGVHDGYNTFRSINRVPVQGNKTLVNDIEWSVTRGSILINQ